MLHFNRGKTGIAKSLYIMNWNKQHQIYSATITN